MPRRILMRFTRHSLVALALLLLIAVPVNAAPALHRGSQTNYNLSVTVSFLQSCGPVLGSALSPSVVCPMIAVISPSLNITGTLGWAVTNLNSTTATFNVTRDITPSGAELVAPAMHHTGSLNESINLATRIASILPFIEPEMDRALQVAQASVATSLPAGTSWSSTMSSIDDTMMRQPLHTVWWVNGPLKQNDTVPVLLFDTNVTGSTNIDLGSPIGSRTAWTLTFNKTRSLLPSPLASTTSSILTADNFEFALTFNYDQTSDLLLTASADIHLGFGEETLVQPMPCDSTPTTAPALTVCPATPVPLMREFGIDAKAQLKLSSTTLDMSQRLTPTGSSELGSGSSSVGGSGTGSGNGQGSGGGPGTGSDAVSSSDSGAGYNPGSGSTTTGTGQPANNPAQSKPVAQSVALLPWMYGMLGIIAAAIVTSVVWIARRRLKNAPSQLAAD